MNDFTPIKLTPLDETVKTLWFSRTQIDVIRIVCFYYEIINRGIDYLALMRDKKPIPRSYVPLTGQAISRQILIGRDPIIRICRTLQKEGFIKLVKNKTFSKRTYVVLPTIKALKIYQIFETAIRGLKQITNG